MRGALGAATLAIALAATWAAPRDVGARPSQAALTAPGTPLPIERAAGPSPAPGRVIVALRPGATIPASVAAQVYGASAVVDLPRLGAQLWRVQPGREPDVAGRLATHPDVVYAEPDRLLRILATPNDALYLTHQWNLPRIGAPAAWDVTTGSAAVTVAVVDSGIDPLHPDGPASLRLGCDYVRWRQVSYVADCPKVVDDQNGHGTHVAGIVAARQNNAVGVTGIAPAAGLLAIRVADANGSAYMSDVALALREASDAGSRVVNLSLGGTQSSLTLERAVAAALERGVLVVAAAGNDYQSGSPVEYPAAYPGVLAVGAVTADDQHAAYSNVGDYVALVAPAGDGGGGVGPTSAITSLYPITSGGYAMMAGTSQAAPQVAAAAALVLAARPSLSGGEVATLLRATARPLGGARPNPTFGYGLLDAAAALRSAPAAAQTPMPTPVPPTPTPTPTPTPAQGSSSGSGQPGGSAPATPTATPGQPAPGANGAGQRRLLLPVGARRATGL